MVVPALDHEIYHASMMPSNTQRRAVALIDGMNLFNNAKRAFGYSFPNYDVIKLAKIVCDRLGSHLVETRFYTGVPRQDVKPEKHYFWASKTAAMKQSGVIVYTRRVRQTEPPQEKGIDIRIGLDALALAIEQTCDELIIFSTDQDFTELNRHVRRVADQQSRQIRLVSAFPVAPGVRIRGIRGFKQHRIPRNIYDQCIDPTDYRPRHKRN